MVDEYTRECLAIDMERRLDSANVMERLTALYALLNGEIFYTRTEAKMLIERWPQHDNTFRPHSSRAAG